jgi:hypothetical protein
MPACPPKSIRAVIIIVAIAVVAFLGRGALLIPKAVTTSGGLARAPEAIRAVIIRTAIAVVAAFCPRRFQVSRAIPTNIQGACP